MKLIKIALIAFVLTACGPSMVEQFDMTATKGAEALQSPAPSEMVQAITPLPTATQNALNQATEAHSPTSAPTCGASICEAPGSDSDEDILARLCAVEVRGMLERRGDACVSVVSTVLTRMALRFDSDGTIAGTIGWGCLPTSKTCQFPAYAVNGCRGILPAACPWSYPDSIAYFKSVIHEFLAGRWVAGNPCIGYTYYGSQPFDMGDCIIRASNGQVEGFHY